MPRAWFISNIRMTCLKIGYRYSQEVFQFCTQIAQVLVDCETGQATVESDWSQFTTQGR